MERAEGSSPHKNCEGRYNSAPAFLIVVSPTAMTTICRILLWKICAKKGFERNRDFATIEA
jgi:hypothetical protein